MALVPLRAIKEGLCLKVEPSVWRLRSTYLSFRFFTRKWPMTYMCHVHGTNTKPPGLRMPLVTVVSSSLHPSPPPLFFLSPSLPLSSLFSSLSPTLLPPCLLPSFLGLHLIQTWRMRVSNCLSLFASLPLSLSQKGKLFTTFWKCDWVKLPLLWQTDNFPCSDRKTDNFLCSDRKTDSFPCSDRQAASPVLTDRQFPLFWHSDPAWLCLCRSGSMQSFSHSRERIFCAFRCDRCLVLCG